MADDYDVLLRIIDYLSLKARRLGADEPDNAALLAVIDRLIQRDTQEKDMGDVYFVSGSIGAVGRYATAADPNAFLRDLDLLRCAMRDRATTPEQAAQADAVALAQLEALRGNESGVHRHLRQAGRFALDVAVSIGATLAAEAIRAAL